MRALSFLVAYDLPRLPFAEPAASNERRPEGFTGFSRLPRAGWRQAFGIAFLPNEADKKLPFRVLVKRAFLASYGLYAVKHA